MSQPSTPALSWWHPDGSVTTLPPLQAHTYDGGPPGDEQGLACYECDLPPADHHLLAENERIREHTAGAGIFVPRSRLAAAKRRIAELTYQRDAARYFHTNENKDRVAAERRIKELETERDNARITGDSNTAAGRPHRRACR